MGYTTGDAYAALNKHLAAMNLHQICFDCNGYNQNEAKSLFPGHCLLHARGRFIGALVPEVPSDAAGSWPDQAHHLPGAQVPRPGKSD